MDGCSPDGEASAHSQGEQRGEDKLPTGLLTTDVAKALTFYTGLLGWDARPSPEYTEVMVGKQEVGGMMKLDPAWGPVPPHWGIYFQVDDVASIVGRAQQLGGQVVVPATDIPQRGRFATLADPAGAHFSVYAES